MLEVKALVASGLTERVHLKTMAFSSCAELGAPDFYFFTMTLAKFVDTNLKSWVLS